MRGGMGRRAGAWRGGDAGAWGGAAAAAAFGAAAAGAAAAAAGGLSGLAIGGSVPLFQGPSLDHAALGHLVETPTWENTWTSQDEWDDGEYDECGCGCCE